MIAPAFRTLLVAAIGGAPLAQSGPVAASDAAIPLPAITVGAQKESGAAFRSMTEPLPQNDFRVRRHANSQAALDNGSAFVPG